MLTDRRVSSRVSEVESGSAHMGAESHDDQSACPCAFAHGTHACAERLRRRIASPLWHMPDYPNNSRSVTDRSRCGPHIVRAPTVCDGGRRACESHTRSAAESIHTQRNALSRRDNHSNQTRTPRRPQGACEHAWATRSTSVARLQESSEESCGEPPARRRRNHDTSSRMTPHLRRRSPPTSKPKSHIF